MNERIRVPEIRLIGPEGDQMGVFQTRDAVAKARNLGYDLVEISPNAKPPVCKIMDYGKYKYEQRKKQHEAKKKQTVIHVKEIQMRPATGEHDVQVKISHLRRFLEHGDKAKIIIKFRGREIIHEEMGRNLLKRVLQDLSDIGQIDQEVKKEGKSLLVILAPKKK